MVENICGLLKGKYLVPAAVSFISKRAKYITDKLLHGNIKATGLFFFCSWKLKVKQVSYLNIKIQPNLGDWKETFQNLQTKNQVEAFSAVGCVHQDVFCSFVSNHQTPSTNETYKMHSPETKLFSLTNEIHNKKKMARDRQSCKEQITLEHLLI